MKRLRWIILAVVVTGVVGVAVAVFVTRGRGVGVVVCNTGTGGMRDVRLVVTGRSYAIGDLPPGQDRAVRVNPTGESSIVITYKDGGGVGRQLAVDCYLEPGYSGSIAVDVADGAVTRVENRIGI